MTDKTYWSEYASRLSDEDIIKYISAPNSQEYTMAIQVELKNRLNNASRIATALEQIAHNTKRDIIEYNGDTDNGKN